MCKKAREVTNDKDVSNTESFFIAPLSGILVAMVLCFAADQPWCNLTQRTEFPGSACCLPPKAVNSHSLFHSLSLYSESKQEIGVHGIMQLES